MKDSNVFNIYLADSTGDLWARECASSPPTPQQELELGQRART